MYYADTSHSNNAGLSPYGIPLEAKHTHTTYRHTAATVVKKSKVYGYSSSQSNLPHRYGNSHAI